MAGGGPAAALAPPKRPRSGSPQAGEKRNGHRKWQPLAEVLEAATTLEGLLSLLGEAGKTAAVDAPAAAAALRQLPVLLAAHALAPAASLAQRLDAGEAVEAAALPSTWPEDPEGRAVLWQGDCSGQGVRPGRGPVTSAFLWVHERVEEVLDDASLREAAPLRWLTDIAVFYGSLRPGPPLPLHILEDCADEALRRLQARHAPAGAEGARGDDLALLCRLARGVATSQALSRHGLYAAAALCAASAIRGAREVPWRPVHDAAVALAFCRPWDVEAATAAAALLSELRGVQGEDAQSGTPGCGNDAVEEAANPEHGRSGPVLACASRPGERNGDIKENQDAFHTALQGDVAVLVMVDGHGKRGAAVASEIRGTLRRQLRRLPSGPAAAQGLADALLSADAALLLHPKVEAELSGAACAVVRVEGLASAAPNCRRLAVAHLGDCRAIMGRRQDGAGGEDARWSAVRLTEDHRPGDAAEAARLVAAGGRVRKAPLLPVNGGSGGPHGDGAAVGYAGPSRLWHRGGGGVAPGLAMSRGMGDALGQGCGLSTEATTLETPLGPGDAVVVVASDGVFDVLSDAEVLHCCRIFWPSRSVAEAASAVIAAASRAWGAKGLGYRDDCTCAVLFL